MINFSPSQSIVFSDLDGCLLNDDYTFSEALPALQRLHEFGIPLVLASSKTEAEMLPIADEIGVNTPMVCENGGLISWRGYFPHDDEINHTFVGTPRQDILELLEQLKSQFQFRSFNTLGVDGIVEVTGLSPVQAERAAQRLTNEPMLWDDKPEKLEDFKQKIESEGLSLTRGGRFWHIAGKVNKGDGLRTVFEQFSNQSNKRLSTVAVGDSPIDLFMLELADLAIVIPGSDGEVKIKPQNKNVMCADHPGSAGWNQTLQNWMDSFS